MGIMTIYVGVFVYLELTTVRKETAIEADEFSVAIQEVPEEVELTLQQDPAFQAGGDVRNVVRDASDTRQRSNQDWSQDAASSTRSGNPEQSARDFERSLYDEFGGAKEPEGPPLKTRNGTSEIQATLVDTIQQEPLWSRLR